MNRPGRSPLHNLLRYGASAIAFVIAGLVPQVASAMAIDKTMVNCAAMKSPYDYSRQVASTCYVTDPLLRVETLRDGGKRYWYRHSNGMLSADLVPPPGFNPVTATASQLEDYGLPPRPSSFVALTEWQGEMSRAWWSTPPSFIVELPASEADQAAPVAASGAVPLSGGNPNQAGWGGYIPANYGSHASVSFKEPAFPTTCSNPGDAVYGALQSSDLFGQDGSISDYNIGGGPNEAFWQVWAQGLLQGTNEQLFYIPNGHTVRANVNYPSNEFTGTVTDVNTGQISGWSLPAFGGYLPNLGEAVVEHLQGYSLPNFGTVSFSASSADGTSLNNLTHGPFNAADGSMVTNPIGTNGSFSIGWKHC